jgi:hypothetical protein
MAADWAAKQWILCNQLQRRALGGAAQPAGESGTAYFVRVTAAQRRAQNEPRAAGTARPGDDGATRVPPW